MATVIAVTVVHPGNRTERALYSDDAFGRRRSAHRAMQAAIGGAGMLWQRGESDDGGVTFAGPSTAVYVPAHPAQH